MRHSYMKEVNKNSLGSKLALVLAVFILIQGVVPALFNNTHHVQAAVTSDLTATINSSSSINLNWNDYLTNEKYYTIEKRVDSGYFYELYSNLSGNNTTIYDYNLSTGHTYTYRVWVTDADNNKYLYTQELSLRTDDISAANSLTISPVSNSQIDLVWGYPNNKNYNTIIERKVEGGTWYRVATIGIGQNAYSDKNISSGFKYYYRVRATSNNNVMSTAYPINEEDSSTYTLLNKPTDVYGIALSSNYIQLYWTDNSAETYFEIDRKSPNDSEFSKIAIVSQNNNTYIDYNQHTPGAIYLYRIKAVSGINSSEYSDVISVTNSYLKEPGTLTSLCVDLNSVQLQWQDLTDNETGFEIWRKLGSSTTSKWELYDTMGRNATTFTDFSISANDTYTYKVRAKINDNNIYSGFSNETVVKSASISAPIDLYCKVVGTNEVKLNFKDTSMTEAGYQVERKTGLSGQWYVIANLDPNITTYNDKWVNSTEIYFYRIKVFDKTNSVNYSNEIAVSLKIPDSPSKLKANTLSTTEIKLTWEDNSDYKSEFIIESKEFYSFREIARVNKDITSFVCKDLAPNTTLTFRVRAANGNKESANSNEVVAATKAKITYSDIYGVKWAEKAITEMASRNVFDAKANSKFYPNQKITVGEYCAFIIRSLELGKVTAGRFKDVTPTHKYYKEIMSAAKVGIISADKNNKIYPNKLVTRQEAAVMLALALKVKDNPLPNVDTSSLKNFADYRSISSAFTDEIAAVCGAGIMSGRINKGKVYLELKAPVTRAEAAVLAYKAFNIK